MYNGKVNVCGVDTGKLPRLKEKETEELIRSVNSGDNSARDKLINGNLRLVLSVVQRFSNRGENPDDLFQVGCIGLIKSIDNFDVNQNVKFSTYAVPTVYIRRNSKKEYIAMTRKTEYESRKDTYIKTFIEEYNRIKPTGARQFDKNRSDNCLSWQTVAKKQNCKSWRNLLKELNLKQYYSKPKPPKRQSFNIKVFTDIDDDISVYCKEMKNKGIKTPFTPNIFPNVHTDDK